MDSPQAINGNIEQRLSHCEAMLLCKVPGYGLQLQLNLAAVSSNPLVLTFSCGANERVATLYSATTCFKSSRFRC